VLTESDGTEIRAPGRFIAGRPLPIVALDTPQLMEMPMKLERWLVERTAVLLVPVIDMKTGEIVDSFLTYHEANQWWLGGYANTEIAHVANALRSKHSNGQRREQDFYLVSIPEQASFFAAGLASVDDGDSELRPARQVLDELADLVKRYPRAQPKPGAPLTPRPN
jgi:hypothetical protein